MFEAFFKNLFAFHFRWVIFNMKELYTKYTICAYRRVYIITLAVPLLVPQSLYLSCFSVEF